MFFGSSQRSLAEFHLLPRGHSPILVLRCSVQRWYDRHWVSRSAYHPLFWPAPKWEFRSTRQAFTPSISYMDLCRVHSSVDWHRTLFENRCMNERLHRIVAALDSEQERSHRLHMYNKLDEQRSKFTIVLLRTDRLHWQLFGSGILPWNVQALFSTSSAMGIVTRMAANLAAGVAARAVVLCFFVARVFFSSSSPSPSSLSSSCELAVVLVTT